MRSTLTQPAAVLALLAMVVQVAVGALGGRVCIRMAPFPQSSGCATDCCEDSQTPEEVPTLFVSLSDRGLPADSDCCVEVGPDEIMQVADHRGLQDLDEIVAPMDASRTDPLGGAPTRATIRSGLSAHPPPSLTMVRATILLI